MNSDSIPQETSESEPYPASFLDRFMGVVERLPIPYGLTYLLLFILQSSTFHVLSWVDGWLPAYTFSPLVLLFPLWLWGPLAIMTYLNSIARAALASFSPLLDIEHDALRRLEYEFTTMPARSVIISGLMWASLYLVMTYAAFNSVYTAFRIGTVFTLIIILEGLISYCAGSAIYYHSIRQLRLVNRTVKTVKQFDLFRLDPVYAFSLVTSHTGIAWMILLVLTLLLFPIQLAPVPVLALLITQVMLALAAFALPLRIVNLRLVAEKRRLLADLDQRVKTMLARLHRCLDDNELGEMDQINGAITALNAERDILANIPTWPWRAGLLTGFLSVVVLPIILFLIQLVLGNWLGK